MAKRALFSATIAVARLAICVSLRLAKPAQLLGSSVLPAATAEVSLVSTRGKRALLVEEGLAFILSAIARFLAVPRKAVQAATDVELTLKAPLLSSTAAERR